MPDGLSSPFRIREAQERIRICCETTSADTAAAASSAGAETQEVVRRCGARNCRGATTAAVLKKRIRIAGTRRTREGTAQEIVSV